MKKLSIVLISLFTLSFVGLHAQEVLTKADTLMIVSGNKKIVLKDPKTFRDEVLRKHWKCRPVFFQQRTSMYRLL